MRRALPVLCLAALAGCSGAQEPASADEAIDAWINAINAGDRDRACDLSIGEASRCQALLREAVPGRGRLELQGETVNSTTGQTSFKIGGARFDSVTAEQRDGKWRIRFATRLGG